MAGYLLTVNGGSSSVKLSLFGQGLSLKQLVAEKLKCANSQAGPEVLAWITTHTGSNQIAAIGHRIVHGGPKYLDHALITPEMIAELKRVAPIDPDHLPGEIALIEALAEAFPKAPQIACFDTAFHRDLPLVARQLPIPRKYLAAGMRRYGFHGLSFSYLMEELAKQAGQRAAQDRIILAHLGAGASMAAVKEGKCIDTTMSFTPTAGLVMATRCGDLDPGVLLYLMREEKLTADELDELVNKQSGLLGVSGISADMQALLRSRDQNPHAAEAVDIFCYQARKWIGAMAAALGGIETLVFSGGIGENSPEIRSQICSELGHVLVKIDPLKNMAGQGLISPDESGVAVHVIPTNEELMIAQIVSQLTLPVSQRS